MRKARRFNKDTFNNILNAVNRDNSPDTLTCSFCGKVKNEITFIIGYNPAGASPEWVMIAGSGKVACPECYEQERKGGRV